jgi:hypothetical protein
VHNVPLSLVVLGGYRSHTASRETALIDVQNLKDDYKSIQACLRWSITSCSTRTYLNYQIAAGKEGSLQRSATDYIERGGRTVDTLLPSARRWNRIERAR